MTDEPTLEEATAAASLALKRIIIFFGIFFVLVMLGALGWLGEVVQSMVLDGLGLKLPPK